MKAVILAAGRGKRMLHLTEDTPKPMLEVAGKTLLEHKITMMPDEIDEVVLVVGYHGEQVCSYFGDSFDGRAITYVHTDVLDGTGGALWKAREHLTERFLVMMGDDIYCREDMEALLQHDWAMGVAKLSWLERGGRVTLNEDGTLADIVEGTHQVANAMVNIGMFVLQPDIFSYDLVKLPDKDEYGLPQTILSAVRDGHRITLVESRFWMQMTSPEDIEKAEQFFSSDQVPQKINRN
ncbi:MAG: sugar phosphate nucleotidyltransferase [Candidatus Paceibacterota bacterium]